jgi:hypothetical protein
VLKAHIWTDGDDLTVLARFKATRPGETINKNEYYYICYASSVAHGSLARPLIESTPFVGKYKMF